MKNKQILYLDGTATTKPTKLALQTFNDICENHWLNPSSTTYSADAHNLLEKARETISDWICCRPDQVFFTSGSTEAANWIIQTFAPRWDEDKSNYLFLTTVLEHPCVFNSMKFMQKCCYQVEALSNNRNGVVYLQDLDERLKFRPTNKPFTEKRLVCVMDSNNELGTIEPTHEIAEICHENGAKLMTDMTQSFANSVEIDVTHLGMDYAFGSAQKFGALRGCGFLYARDPDTLSPFMYGGKQESGIRGGTENLAGICAMAEQFADIASLRFEKSKKLRKLRTYLLNNLPDGVIYNTPLVNTLDSIVSLRTPVDAGQLVAALALDGIYLSAGSACSTGQSKPSRILKACGYTDDEARHTIRVSLNENLTEKDLDRFIVALMGNIQMLGESE